MTDEEQCFLALKDPQFLTDRKLDQLFEEWVVKMHLHGRECPAYTKKGPGRYHKQGNDGDDTFRRLKGF